MPTIQKNKIIWDSQDWFEGLDQTSASVYNKKGVGIANSQKIDPLRSLGYISPGFNATNLTNYTSVTGTLLSGVVDADSAYCVSSDAKVQKITSLNTGTISTTSPYPKTITGATAGQDICVYYVNVTSTRTKRIFYSWKDGSNGNVGTLDTSSDTFDVDWLSTIPANAATLDTTNDHPLIVGDDDILYIGDGNNVHALDGATGADGTLYKNVLTLPKGWIITSFAKTNDYKLAIGAYFTSSASGSTFNLGQAKVYVWDYLSLDPTYIYNLNDNYVSEICNWKGTLIAFTQGRQSFVEPNISKVQVLNGSQFEVMVSYLYGSSPRRGGVDIINDDLIWNASGRIYTYSRIPGKDGYVLNSPFGNSVGDETSGLCKIFSSTLNIIYSCGSGSLSAAVNAKTGYADSSTLNTKTAYPFTNDRMRGRIKSITVKLQAETTDANGRQLTLSTILDKSTANIVINSDPTIGIQTTYYLNADGTPLGDFTSLGLELLWSGGSTTTACPVIDSVIADYTEITI